MLFHNYSHYSVLSSIMTPAQIAEMAEHHNLKSVAIADINNMAGIVQFHKACTKKDIKPIIGMTAKFKDDSTVLLLAKNRNGFNNLLKLNSDINDPNKNFGTPQITYEMLAESSEDIVCIDGYKNSALYQNIDEPDEHIEKMTYNTSLDYYLSHDAHSHDSERRAISEISDTCNISVCSTKNIRFTNYREGKTRNGERLYEIIRSKFHKCKIDSLSEEIEYSDENIGDILTDAVNETIDDEIEAYDILSPPALPEFKCPEGKTSIEYLTDLCREGFKKKGLSRERDTEYVERIKYELGVFKEAGLCDYFLILQDIINWAEDQGYLIGPARGSSAGCLTAYLTNITKIDPIQYGLIFSRFFNEGRKGSLPDIDVDFPKRGRDNVIQYIIDTYGEEHTGQIATYQTFMGRAALKAVLSAETDLSYMEVNEITKNITDKAKISDELEAMKKDGQYPSVILWSLINRDDSLSPWVRYEDGEFTGPLAKEFELAIDLEGIKSAQSRHAAGVIITKNKLKETVPTLYDKESHRHIVGIEFEDAEAMSACKLDCLGISTLDRLEDIN